MRKFQFFIKFLKYSSLKILRQFYAFNLNKYLIFKNILYAIQPIMSVTEIRGCND